MPARLACTLPLPERFRAEDILAFQRRDPLAAAERADAASLWKGLVWRDAPARLSVVFGAGAAEAELAIDGRSAPGDTARFIAQCERMLALTQDIEAFEQRYAAHPQLGPLIANRRGLRVAVTATPFEALAWAVTCQQISVRAGIALRRRLIAAAGLRHSSGLLCHPDARRVAALGVAELRAAGFSTAKANTLCALAQMVADDALPLDEWARTPPVDTIRRELAAVRGVGPWTIDYVLLRGFGWLDGSLHGDVAVRRGLQTLLGVPDAVDECRAREWLAQFSPWRALVAAHLWALRAAAAF